MIKTLRHILKADEVTFDEPLPLDLASASPPNAPRRCTSADPRVRIAQSHARYAVLEVICSCGQTIHVRCDYGAGDPSPGPADAGTSVGRIAASGGIL